MAELKTELQNLTSVPLDRQKLVCKGKSIDDETKYAALIDKSVIMMIGSAVVVTITQTQAGPTSDAQSSLILAPGLQNLGNTCWMNSTLKALYTVTELREALLDFAALTPKPTPSSLGSMGNRPTANEVAFVLAVGKLYNEIKNGIANDEYSEDSPLVPDNVVIALSKCYPQFFSLEEENHRQQDADDFLVAFLATLDKILVKKDAETGSDKRLIRELFYYDIETVTKPKKVSLKVDSTAMTDGDDEKKDVEVVAAAASTTTTTTTEEPETKSYDTATKLSIPVGVDSTDIQGGVKQSLTDTITKRSSVTNKDEEYNREQFLVTLPKYSIVQLQRFSWKSTENGQGSGAKLIRKVNISPQLDLYNFCTEALRAKLEPYRKTLEALRQETLSAMNDGESKTSTTKNNAGYYDLVSIISHQGRTMDSGHYVAWTKSGNNTYNEKALTGMNDKEKEKLREMSQSKAFMKHDDDRSSFAPEKVLTDLAGGGDFHMGYLCIYKARYE